MKIHILVRSFFERHHVRRRWKHQQRLREVKVDSGGLGFHLVTIIHTNGSPAEGLNASSSASEKERFANLKSRTVLEPALAVFGR
jgi:hypothetical protein